MAHSKPEGEAKSAQGPAFTIRRMELADVDKCLEIWARVNLTEAKQTVASSVIADPDAFQVAELNETGEIIGMCAGPLTREDTAFIGFYGVDPIYQGLGIGRELWAKTLARLDPELNVGLYGVPEMAEKYKRAGFKLQDSTSMLVFESEPDKGDELKLDSLASVADLPEGSRLEVLSGLEESADLLDRLIIYDRSIHGYSRRKLLEIYLRGEDIPLTLIMLDPAGNLIGYGIIRADNNSGGIIGPIYANDDSTCEVLLAELIARFPLEEGRIYSVMPLTSNQVAVDTLRKIGLVEREECSRLFTKFVPKTPSIDRIYYVHTPNFTLF